MMGCAGSLIDGEESILESDHRFKFLVGFKSPDRKTMVPPFAERDALLFLSFLLPSSLSPSYLMIS
jgi:hypothetical protein